MLNHIVIMGRLTRDPELRKTTNDTSVVTISIAVDRGGKDKGADFFDIVAWRNTAEFVCKYFQKGSPIVIEGSIQTRTWEDKAGQKRKSVEVIADNIEFVPRTKDSSAPSFRDNGMDKPEFAPPIAESAPVVYSAGEAEDFTVVDDADLPF